MNKFKFQAFCEEFPWLHSYFEFIGLDENEFIGEGQGVIKVGRLSKLLLECTPTGSDYFPGNDAKFGVLHSLVIYKRDPLKHPEDDEKLLDYNDNFLYKLNVNTDITQDTFQPYCVQLEPYCDDFEYLVETAIVIGGDSFISQDGINSYNFQINIYKPPKAQSLRILIDEIKRDIRNEVRIIASSAGERISRVEQTRK